MLQTEPRKLAAIMFTDMVSFSRQMGADEARMLRVLTLYNQVIQQTEREHHGHVIKTLGDGFLVDFPSVVNAVQCAQRVQAQFRTHNDAQEKGEQIHSRIGIHLGDIVQRDGDVYGNKRCGVRKPCLRLKCPQSCCERQTGVAWLRSAKAGARLPHSKRKLPYTQG